MHNFPGAATASKFCEFSNTGKNTCFPASFHKCRYITKILFKKNNTPRFEVYKSYENSGNGLLLYYEVMHGEHLALPDAFFG
jgi:hypothetical protein